MFWRPCGPPGRFTAGRHFMRWRRVPVPPCPVRPGWLAQRRVRELGHASRKARLSPEAEPAGTGRGVRCRHHVPDVAEPVLAGDLGRRAAERPGEGGRHLADRVRFPARDVERAQRTRLPRVQRGQVGPGHVVDVDEVPALATVLEDLRRLGLLPARTGR